MIWYGDWPFLIRGTMISAKALSSLYVIFIPSLELMRSAIYSLLAISAEYVNLSNLQCWYLGQPLQAPGDLSLRLHLKTTKSAQFLHTWWCLHLSLLAHAGSKLQICECFLCALISLPIVDLSFPRVAAIEVLVEPFSIPLWMICLSERVRCRFLFDLAMIISLSWNRETDITVIIYLKEKIQLLKV